METARQGTRGIEADIARLRSSMAGRAPAYGRALDLLPPLLAGPTGLRVEEAWRDRRFFAWYDRPLLLLAALRDDALREGPSHPLFAGFAAREPSVEAVTEERIAGSLDAARASVFEALAHRRVQTNETSRAVTWLWPAALAGASGGRRAIALADVGASAGLNLVADALPSIWSGDDGAPVEVASHVDAVARLGLDPAPVDALRDDDVRWLRACVWPGEAAREERLMAAVAAFRAARTSPAAPVIVPIGAAIVPARLDLLSAAEAGVLVVAYQTVVRDYLAPDEREEYERGMQAWLATHPAGLSLWVELEAAREGGEPPAAIVAHVRARRGEVRTLELGRCGFHPEVIRRRRDAETELRALLGPGPS